MRTLTRRCCAAAATLLLVAVPALPAARAAHSRAGVTLTMWAWADRELCAKAYQKEHPEVTIKYVVQDKYIPKLNVLKRGGGGGIPDVLFANSEDVANLYQLGYTTDLSAAIPASVRAQYAPGTLDPLTIGGKLVAFPHDMAAIGIWYNVKNLKAAGLSLPKSYDDVFADAAKLAKTKQFQISWFGADGNAIETLAWGSQARWFTHNADNSYSVSIATPQTEGLATKYVAAVRSGGVLPDNPFGPVSGKAYAAGKVVYAVSANWLGAYGIQPGYPKQKGEWSFAASLPSVGWWGGAMFLVPPQGQNQAESRKLALYCSTSAAFQGQVGTVPAYTGVYNAAGAFKPNAFFADPQGVVAQLKLSAQHTGKGWVFSPNMNYVDVQGGTAVAAMINGASVHDTLAKYQQQVVSNLKLIGVKVK